MTKMQENLLDAAKTHIERGTTEWYDWCAEQNQIPGNIGHMRTIQKSFANHLIATTKRWEKVPPFTYQSYGEIVEY